MRNFTNLISQSSFYSVTTITGPAISSYVVQPGVNILHVEACAGGGGGGGPAQNSTDRTKSGSGAGGNSGGYINCFIMFSSYVGHSPMAYAVGGAGAGGARYYGPPAFPAGTGQPGAPGGSTILQVNGLDIFNLVGGIGGNPGLHWTSTSYLGGTSAPNGTSNSFTYEESTHIVGVVNLKAPKQGGAGACSNTSSENYNPGTMEANYGLPIAEHAGKILRVPFGTSWPGAPLGTQNHANGGAGAYGWLGQGGTSGYPQTLGSLIGSNARGYGSGGAGGSTMNIANGSANGSNGSPGVMTITAYKGPIVDTI